MKTIYLVRHGEAEVNVSDSFAAESSPLTERGKEQAEALAERCARLPAEVLIASTMARAHETAEAISKRSKLPIVSSDLFVERTRPSALVGKRRDDPGAKELQEQWSEGFFKPDIRVKDGENFSDLKVRAEKMLMYLENCHESNILVVMHGFVLRVLIARVIFGETLTPEEFYRVARAFQTVNTGITKLEFDPSRERDTVYPRGAWAILAWNDHAHLG